MTIRNHRDLRYLDDTNRFQSPSNKLIKQKGEGKKHFKLKNKLFDFLTRQDNPDVRCECIFKNGTGKADIIDFTNRFKPAIVYEIRVSEPLKSLENKKKKFPYNRFLFRIIESVDDIYGLEK